MSPKKHLKSYFPFCPLMFLRCPHKHCVIWWSGKGITRFAAEICKTTRVGPQAQPSFYFNSKILTSKAKQRLGLRETVGPLSTVPHTYICVREENTAPPVLMRVQSRACQVHDTEHFEPRRILTRAFLTRTIGQGQGSSPVHLNRRGFSPLLVRGLFC